MAKLDERIGFIGGGNMAFAIGSGLISRGIIKSSQVLVSGPHIENLEKWREIGTATTEENGDVVTKSDIIFLCVKPHMLITVASQMKSSVVATTREKDKVFVSVLAGVTLAQLAIVSFDGMFDGSVIKKYFFHVPDKLKSFDFITTLKMVRTMPNTPMQVGEGCTIYSPGSYVTQHDLEKVHLLLNSLGLAQQVPEKMINAIGAVTGCGPAYVYTIIEALADGSVKQGVPRQMAIQFAAQTLLGAAKTVLQTGKHPAVLRDEVCSPGGTTIHGVHELEKGGLRNALINAVEKAAERAEQVGKLS